MVPVTLPVILSSVWISDVLESATGRCVLSVQVRSSCAACDHWTNKGLCEFRKLFTYSTADRDVHITSPFSFGAFSGRSVFSWRLSVGGGRSPRAAFFYSTSKFFHGDWGAGPSGPLTSPTGGRMSSFIPVRQFTRVGQTRGVPLSSGVWNTTRGLAQTSAEAKGAAMFFFLHFISTLQLQL